VDGSAAISLYSGFRQQGSRLTTRTNLFFNKLSGAYGSATLGSGEGAIWQYAPLAADLNQDERTELYIGTETGGIVNYLSGTQAILAIQPDPRSCTRPGATGVLQSGRGQ
jgi:hypothetical protein